MVKLLKVTIMFANLEGKIKKELNMLALGKKKLYIAII